MLTPAHVGHLPFLKRLLRDGAAEGSFGRELARPGPATDAFYASLRQALQSGYFVQPDPLDNRPVRISVTGYVYSIAGSGAPIGFGFFKEFSRVGYEFWLAGLEAPFRGKGHGRAMFEELLATPVGQLCRVARCPLGEPGPARAAQILLEQGYRIYRTTDRSQWLVHTNTPAAIVQNLSGVRALQPAAK